MVNMVDMLEQDMIPLGDVSDASESNLCMDQICEKFDADDFEADIDSDSAPETFSFSAAQAKKRLSEKFAAESLKQQKSQLKKKRKAVLLQNMEQREKKRQKIDSKRLPDHILQNLDDDYPDKLPQKALEDLTEVLEEKKPTKKDILHAVGNITFKCKILSVEAKNSKYISENMAPFKDSLLYSKRIKREKSNRHAVLKSEKIHTRR